MVLIEVPFQMTYRSIIEWLGGDGSNSEGSKCGYCKSKNTCFTNDGMWAHWMTPSDYQELIDRGWRRSGKYCYKPDNEKTCCPMYTIRLNAAKFKCSRTQKRVIAKMNEFLNSGVKANNSKREPQQEFSNKAVDTPQPTTQLSAPAAEPNLPTLQEPQSPENSEPEKLTPKRHCGTKKRQQRIDRRIAKGKPFKRATADTPPKPLRERLGKNVKLEISNDGKQVTIRGKANTLEIKLLKVDSKAEKNLMAESHAIYEIYQSDIHNDKDNTMKQWSRFLRANPFRPEDEMGLYHCHYRLNGKNYQLASI